MNNFITLVEQLSNTARLKRTVLQGPKGLCDRPGQRRSRDGKMGRVSIPIKFSALKYFKLLTFLKFIMSHRGSNYNYSPRKQKT